VPRLAGGAAAESLELTSGDGTRFGAAYAESPDPRAPAVLILPDVRGLYRFYVELAERFAEAGHHALVLDYFGRSAGVGERDDEFDYMSHMARITVDGLSGDVAAAIAELRSRTGDMEVATVGFCFGGAVSFLGASALDFDVLAAVGLYGALSGGRFGMPPAKEASAHARVPVLALFGGADEAIPAEDREQFERGLQQSGVPYELHTYPGAPHSFFDRKYVDFADESEDAWRRMLAFLQRLHAFSTTS
jgi:carboxymethylenebutenolidase